MAAPCPCFQTTSWFYYHQPGTTRQSLPFRLIGQRARRPGEIASATGQTPRSIRADRGCKAEVEAKTHGISCHGPTSQSHMTGRLTKPMKPLSVSISQAHQYAPKSLTGKEGSGVT